MTIEKEDFLMESTFPDNEYNFNWFFDLSVNKTVKGKDGNRSEWKVIGYSCVTSYCIDVIARYRTETEEDYKIEFNKLYNEFKDLGLRMETDEIKCNLK